MDIEVEEVESVDIVSEYQSTVFFYEEEQKRQNKLQQDMSRES